MNDKLKILLASALIFVSAAAFGQNQKRYYVMFYNLENLFDTENDPNINDEEFLPNGAKRWTVEKYNKKQHNMARVIASVAADNRAFPAVIGVSEIENRRVLEDLVSQDAIASANYQIVHHDSPDLRGIDVAFLYRPDQFQKMGNAWHKVTVPYYPEFKTRDVVAMWGKVDGEMFGFVVGHMPSRRGGSLSSTRLRNAAAESIRFMADSLQKAFPGIKLAIMGDMNDNPTDRSLREIIGAREKYRSQVREGEYYNPFLDMFNHGEGTCKYQDNWSLFDNIIVNYNLLDTGRLRLQPSTMNQRVSRKGEQYYYGNIYNKKQFMIEQSGQYKGYPLRTFSGDNFQNGFSDHFPVFIILGE
ncbi:MAG: endonuclease/exonuclease/phosphatase family protein [Bacteroidales bacterium]